MLENLHWLGHASFYVRSAQGTVVYFDPYKLKAGLPQADLILVTHDHFDHCSPEDINRVAKPGTVVVAPAAAAAKIAGSVRILSAGMSLRVADVSVAAVPAYNTDKKFHPRAAGYIGYVATVDGVAIYHAGDTDHIPEMGSVKADVALLPVGGTYTMDAAQAAAAADAIRPQVAVPMHYGEVVGSDQDAREFQRLCKAEVRILRRE